MTNWVVDDPLHTKSPSHCVTLRLTGGLEDIRHSILSLGQQDLPKAPQSAGTRVQAQSPACKTQHGADYVNKFSH
jgi:hypothetical protein